MYYNFVSDMPTIKKTFASVLQRISLRERARRSDATETAVEDREFVRAYEEWAQADEEGTAFRAGALAAAADRWRDGPSPDL